MGYELSGKITDIEEDSRGIRFTVNSIKLTVDYSIILFALKNFNVPVSDGISILQLAKEHLIGKTFVMAMQ